MYANCLLLQELFSDDRKSSLSSICDAWFLIDIND